MAPKRKPAGRSASSKQFNAKSPGKTGRTVQDLLSAAPPSKCRKTVKSFFASVPRPAAPLRSSNWADQYAPTSRGDLAVHKKKVEKLAEWLEAAIRVPGSLPTGALCCCISGPPGSGRSTSIKTLAQEYQCNVHRWAFPTPTLWSEHRHIGAESRYVSKMDEFQAMVGDMKFNALTWTSTQALDNCSLEKRGDGSLTGCRQACVPKWAPPEDVKSCTISIINDFPHLHSPEARSQFCDHLMVLVQSARRPTILLVTDSGKARSSVDAVPSSGQQRTCNVEHLIVDTAVKSGAVHIPFNPITARACIRELQRIAKAERLTASDPEMEALVEEAQYDLHNAIQALQLQAVGQQRQSTARVQPKVKRRSKPDDRHTRDIGLSLFHALGKILYNKRMTDVAQQEDAQAGGTELTQTQKQLSTRGFPVLSAEEVVARSGLGAGVVTSFLFESYLEFVAEESVADAAAAAENFSDAMCMLGQASSGALNFGKQWVDTEHSTASPADAVAAALSCRGYMWANQHPATRKWQPICAPKMSLVARAAAYNRAELAERSAFGRREIEPAVMSAVQVIPYARLMASAAHDHPARKWLPVTWRRWWAGSVVEDGGGGVNMWMDTCSMQSDKVNDTDDDPIEG